MLTDGSSTDSSTLNIGVTPANDDFTDNNESITIDEDSGETTGNVIDGSSVDGDVTVQSFTINGESGPFTLGQPITINGVGTFTLSGNGAYSFTPADNFNGDVPEVTYVLTDGSSTDSSTLNIGVTPANDDFTDNNESITIDEDSGETTGNVIDGSSVDGDVTVQSFTINGESGPFTLGQPITINGVGTFTLSGNGAYSFTPADNFNGDVPEVTYVLSDGSSTDSSTLNIGVTPVNDDFTDNNESITIDEDSGETTGNVIDGSSVDGDVTVQSFTINGESGPFVLGQPFTISGVGTFHISLKTEPTALPLQITSTAMYPKSVTC